MQPAEAAQPAEVPQQSEQVAGQAEGATQAAPQPVEAAAAAATQPPAQEQQPARFTVASAGDYRIGLHPKKKKVRARHRAGHRARRSGCAEREREQC